MWKEAAWESRYKNRKFRFSRAKDRDLAYQLIATLVHYFRDQLYLTLWEFEIAGHEWGEKPADAHAVLESTIHLNVEMEYQYETAHINAFFNPEGKEIRYIDIREVVLHEMMHVVLQTYVGPTTAALLEMGLAGYAQTKNTIGRLLLNAEETLTDRLVLLLEKSSAPPVVSSSRPTRPRRSSGPR